MANESPKYTKYSQGYLKWLNHSDVEKRRKAAKMVGELGVAEAIPQLVDMVENDSDKVVRENARFSLGMFQAFKEAVEDDETADEAYDVVTKLATTAQIGKPAKISDGTLRGIVFSLVGLLVVFLGVNAAIILGILGGADSPNTEGTAIADGGGSDPAGDRDALTTLAQARINELEANAGGLNSGLTLLASGEEPGDACMSPYYSYEPLPLSDTDAEMFPQVAGVYTRLNEVLVQFNDARGLLESACFDGAVVSVGEAEAALDMLGEFQSSIPQLEAALEAVSPTQPPPPPTEPPQIEPTETPAPTSTPDFSSDVARLYGIIDDVQGARGANTILNQYWREAANNGGETNGCRGGFSPDIPSNYVLAVPEAAPENLLQAVNNVNQGLQTLRDGWATFNTACAAGPLTVLENANAGLTVADSVAALFGTADLYLQQLRGITPAVPEATADGT